MKKNSCENCENCRSVYRALSLRFSKDKLLYYCESKEEFTKLECTCENWLKKEKAKCDFSKERFEKTVEDIKAIKKLLKGMIK